MAPSSSTIHPTRHSERGEPTWELVHFFPNQGEWTEAAYLALNAKRLVEFADGCLEFPPVPTRFHQLIVLYLYKILDALVAQNSLGEVHVAPLPVRLAPGKFREPDVVFLRPERL